MAGGREAVDILEQGSEQGREQIAVRIPGFLTGVLDSNIL